MDARSVARDYWLKPMWDLDDVMYGGVAEPAQRLAWLAWMHGDRLYEENGGDEALQSEAEVLASLCGGEQ